MSETQPRLYEIRVRYSGGEEFTVTSKGRPLTGSLRHMQRLCADAAWAGGVAYVAGVGDPPLSVPQ